MFGRKKQDKFEQFIKSNKDLLAISTEFQNDIYATIVKSDDPNESSQTQDIQTAITASINKLETKELTIAVVGEIKAGKSTLINALVGYDISHARTTAATTFPIRIKHVPNHGQGVDFHFTPKDEFWKLANKVKKHLTKMSEELWQQISEFHNTIDFIKGGDFQPSTYNQNNLTIEQIKKRLECLHDFPRVYEKIFPNEVNGMQSIIKYGQPIPEIILEFPTIKNLPNTSTEGNIILIDTPGVGESGKMNQIIQNLVKEQIASSSTVMAILEKGGKNSENEEIIKSFIESCKAPSYLIAGKMDEYNNNGADEDIATLLQQIQTKYGQSDKFQIKKIFPISQNRAVTGITALKALNEHGALNDPYKDHSGNGQNRTTELVQAFHNRQDFIRYQEQQEGYEELLQETPDQGYKKMIMEEYLDNKKYSFQALIDEFAEINRNAEKLILLAGQEQLLTNFQKQSNVIDEISKVANQKADTIKNAIVAIDPLIANIATLGKKVNHAVEDQEKTLTNLEKSLVTSTNNRVEAFFEKMESSFSDDDIVYNAPKKSTTEIVGATVFGLGKSLFNKVTGNSNNEELFADAPHSNSGNTENIGDCAKAFRKAEIARIKTDLKKASKHIDDNIKDISKNIKQIVKELNNVIEDQFSFQLSLPDIKTLDVGRGMDLKLSIDNHMEEKEHFQQVENNGFFGSIQRGVGSIVNTDWGYHDEAYYRNELNRAQFFRDFKNQLYGSLKLVLQDFSYVATGNMEKLEKYHKDLNENLIRIKKELQQIIQDKENNSQAMEQRITRMHELVSEIESMQDLIKSIPLEQVQ